MASSLSYSERAAHCSVEIGKRLLLLLDHKKTNLALSADVTSAEELIHLANELGPFICILKTHIDILEDYTDAALLELRKLAVQHQFLIFEDRKFADIGHTVKLQYQNGIYHIAEWADIINAHSLPGPGVVKGLREAGYPKGRGLLLIAEMSSAGQLMDAPYQQYTLELAKKFSDFVIGFITQHALSPDPHWIYLSPGINLSTSVDVLDQQYVTPEKAILERGSDIIIVGRGIVAAKDPKALAKDYRAAGWEAYLQRCS